MPASARTPVLPEAAPVRALSALSDVASQRALGSGDDCKYVLRRIGWPSSLAVVSSVPLRSASRRLAPLKFAPLTNGAAQIALSRCASLRFAPPRWALLRLVPFRSALLRSAPRRS